MNQPWNAPERDVTPEQAKLRLSPPSLSRRRWLQGLGVAGLGLLGGGAYLGYRTSDAQVQANAQEHPVALDLYPAARNPVFGDAGRSLTDELKADRYTNFYEFSSTKAVYAFISGFQTNPWSVEVTGLVAKPRVYDIDQLARAFPLEERIYRFRCVEAWAMVVPWTGFPLAALLRAAEPLSEARYVRFVSFHDTRQAPRQRNSDQPWPYNEGLTLAEATNPLTFIATGMYGHPLRKQHGAPVRLVVPWKYGYKSAKSIVRIELTAHKPATFWNTLAPHEYDFQSNVNPAVPHPRWSQRTERMLDTQERVPTVLYNGYGEWVASMYS